MRPIDVLLCKDGICPICKSEMQIRTYEKSKNVDVFCTNNCYKIIYLGEEDKNAFIYIYEDYMGSVQKDYAQIVDMVLYWRESDRYIIKLMGV